MLGKQPGNRRIIWLTVTLLLVIVIVAAFAFVLRRHPPGRQRAASIRAADLSARQFCGPYGLHTAASMLGLQVDLTVLVKACNPSPKGVSMATLKEVAGKFGLDAKGYRITWDKLLELRSPAILYVKPSHFVTVNPSKHLPDASADRIRVYDSDKAPQWWSREKLAKSWSGETLVLSEAPRHKPSKGPRIRFDCLIHDLGDVRVPLNKKVDISLAFANVGDQTVKIGRITTTCGCTETSVTSKVIDSDQKGKIDVAVNLDKARGPFDYLVIVETNDKLTPVVKTRIVGRAFNTQLTTRSQLVLHAIPRLGRASKRFVLRDPGDASLSTENVKLLISPASLTDEDGPIYIQAMLTPYDSNEHRFLTAASNDVVVEIDVTTAESAPIGEFEGLLEIMTQVPGDEHIKIPIRGAVISNIMAKPAALFFSSVNGEPISKSITIAGRIAHRIDLNTVSVSPNLPLNVEKASEEDKAIVLTAKYSPSGGQTSTITGDIVCRFADETVLKIPVVIHSQSRQ